jgi:hypothetical protein
MCIANEIKKEEYINLMGEDESNWKYIFEKPAVLFLALVGTLKMLENSDNNVIAFGCLFAVSFLVSMNFFYTMNRVESSCRIIAYVQLFFRPKPNHLKWLGWENALRKYRKDFRDNWLGWPKSEKAKKAENKAKKHKVYFLQDQFRERIVLILVVHLFLIAAICILFGCDISSGTSKGKFYFNEQFGIGLGINVLLWLFIMVRYWPGRMFRRIEIERARWLYVSIKKKRL